MFFLPPQTVLRVVQQAKGACWPPTRNSFVALAAAARLRDTQIDCKRRALIAIHYLLMGRCQAADWRSDKFTSSVKLELGAEQIE